MDQAGFIREPIHSVTSERSLPASQAQIMKHIITTDYEAFTCRIIQQKVQRVPASHMAREAIDVCLLPLCCFYHFLKGNKPFFEILQIFKKIKTPEEIRVAFSVNQKLKIVIGNDLFAW